MEGPFLLKSYVDINSYPWILNVVVVNRFPLFLPSYVPNWASFYSSSANHSRHA